MFFKDILHHIFLNSLLPNSPKKACNKLYQSDFICVSQSLQELLVEGLLPPALSFEDLYLLLLVC